jgi:hypothetical protein
MSWIRRWFTKQDDFTLWAIFVVWCITSLSIALTLITAIAKLIILHRL